ncbi:hypothetical protein H072_8808 [Dactylellina haptotyla CBS 200.50]|uniref:Clr5 domain-containing protein n=1 Tax=Dactylellina haptotyla (strain CBS 200.50) TaxID=1284197 RepID=S8A404_DACHA|nr:hypothetical protein H072_8808 [Dactylellina haptotyla CBS 200.50]
MELQWKPTQSIPRQKKKRITKSLKERDVEGYKSIILQHVHSGTYQSAIETLRDVHRFELSMDQLKKFLKIWNHQKRPRRVPSAELSHQITMPILAQQTPLPARNPFTGIPKGDSGITGILNSAESASVTDSEVETLLGAVENFQSPSSKEPKEQILRQILPRFAHSATLTQNLWTSRKKFNPRDSEGFDEAFHEVKDLLGCLGNNSASGTHDDLEPNIVSTTSIRDFQRDISTISWTNQRVRHLCAFQAERTGNVNSYVSISKKQFRSLTGEIFEKIEVKTLFTHDIDSSASKPSNPNRRALAMRILYQSAERYIPKISIHLNVYQQIPLDEGADDILNAALHGNLAKIQDRCSKGEWSLWSCDQNGANPLSYLIYGAFNNLDSQEEYMGLLALIVSEAPDICFMLSEGGISILQLLAMSLSKSYPTKQVQQESYKIADKILRYLIFAGYDFSDDRYGLLSCLVLGSTDNVRTILYNENFYVDVDSVMVATFLTYVGDPTNIQTDEISSTEDPREASLQKSPQILDLPEKLGMLLGKLVKNTEKSIDIAYQCVQALLKFRRKIPFNDLVESLVMAIDAIGDIYHPNTRKVASYGPFCVTAHWSGNQDQWYAALSKCKHSYTYLQALSWEAEFSGVNLDDYYRGLSGAAGLRTHLHSNGFIVGADRIRIDYGSNDIEIGGTDAMDIVQRILKERGSDIQRQLNENGASLSLEDGVFAQPPDANDGERLPFVLLVDS